MDFANQDLQTRLLSGVRCVIATRYTLNASAVLWMVDWLHTLPVEISMIWGSRFNLVKILFFVNRYPVVDLIAAYILVYNGVAESCQISMIFGIGELPIPFYTHRCVLIFDVDVDSNSDPTSPVCLSTVAIMFLRLYALSGGKKWLKWYLITHFTVIHIAAFVTISIALSQLLWIQSPIPTYVPCIAIEDGAVLATSVFSMLLASEFIILSMTLYIGLKRNKGESSPLWKVLYRDGVVYFVALVASSAMNVILAAVLPPECAGTLCTMCVKHKFIFTNMSLD
ncbi:hypothetical protein MD484_g1563, partial [Candolleomyces efflorescens]